MKIPFMRLDRQFQEHENEFIEITRKVLSHGRVLQGPEVIELERKVAETFHLPYGVTTGSCTDSLIFGLKALGLKTGARVAVSSLSFVASASAILHAGGVPVFVDIDDFYLSDRESLLNLIRKKEIDGIIAVHLYGQMMDLEEIFLEAKKQGIFIIEDAAQVIGSLRNGRPAGAYSDLTTVSFDPTKVIGAFGSGGAVVTAKKEIQDRIVKLRYHGHIGGRVFESEGFNSQLPSLQAAYINYKFDQMDVWQNRRTQIANLYFKELSSIKEVSLPKVDSGNIHNFHKFVIRVGKKRNELMANLKVKGIETSIHYHLPLYQQPLFADKMDSSYFLPKVESACSEVLSLPIYPELRDEEVLTITQSIQDFFNP